MAVALVRRERQKESRDRGNDRSSVDESCRRTRCRRSTPQNQLAASASTAPPSDGERRDRQVSQRSCAVRGPKTDAEVLPQLRQARSGPLGIRNTSVSRRPHRDRGLAENPFAGNCSSRPQFLSHAVPMGEALEIRGCKPCYPRPNVAQTEQDTARPQAERGARSSRRTRRALQDDGSALLRLGIEGLRASRPAMGRLRLAGPNRAGSAQRSAGRSESDQDRGFTESDPPRAGVGESPAPSEVPDVVPRGLGLCLCQRHREAQMAGNPADRPHQARGHSSWNWQDRMAHVSTHEFDIAARTGRTTCCTERAAAPLGHPDHHERVHPSREPYQEASGGESATHSAQEEKCVGVLGTNGYSRVSLIPANCLKRWYAWQDSNLRPFAPEANALSI